MDRGLDHAARGEQRAGATRAHAGEVQREMIGLHRDHVQLTAVGANEGGEDFAANLQELINRSRHLETREEPTMEGVVRFQKIPQRRLTPRVRRAKIPSEIGPK